MTDKRKNEIWDYLPNDIRIKLQHDYIKACEAQELGPHNNRIYAHRMFMRKYFGKNNMEECKELNEHNLTAQAEEKPLFKSNYKAGDKVVITGSLCGSRGKPITLVRQYDCPREANDYQKLWVGQFEDGYTCSIAEKDFTPTVEFEQAEEKPKEPRFNIGEKVRINCYSNGEVWDAVMHNKIVTLQDYYVKDGVNMYVLKEGCRDFGEHCLEPYNEPKEEEIRKERVKSEKFPIDYAQYRLDIAKEIAVAMIAANWEPVDIPRDAVDDANEIVKRLKETEE